MSDSVFTFKASGKAFAGSEAARGRMLSELGEALAPLNFEAWEAARQEFEAGAREAGYADPGRLWQRTISAGQEFGIIKAKPVSETPAAAAKAKQREAAKADTRTVAELKAEAAKLAEAGKLIDAGKLAALAEKKAAADARAAAEAAKEKVKPHVEAIKAALDAMRKAADSQGLEALAYVAGLLANGQHGHVLPAVATLRDAMKAASAAAKRKGAKGAKGKAEPALM